MKVLKWVEFPAQELYVDVSIEDIEASLNETTQDERCGKATSLLTACIQAMQAISDEKIKEQPPAVRGKVVALLMEQVERYQ